MKSKVTVDNETKKEEKPSDGSLRCLSVTLFSSSLLNPAILSYFISYYALFLLIGLKHIVCCVKTTETHMKKDRQKMECCV